MRPEATNDFSAFKTSGPGRNLELKCRHSDLTAAREIVCGLGAVAAGIDLQTDTYFRSPIGRLKLRETRDRPAVLIWYDRPENSGARNSEYHLTPVDDPASMKVVLASALGVRGEVAKRREVYLWHNVRIHLDEVAGVGTLVELEAVLISGDDEALSQTRLERLCTALGIQERETVPVSNADLLGL